MYMKGVTLTAPTPPLMHRLIEYGAFSSFYKSLFFEPCPPSWGYFLGFSAVKENLAALDVYLPSRSFD